MPTKKAAIKLYNMAKGLVDVAYDRIRNDIEREAEERKAKRRELRASKKELGEI